MAAPQIGSIPRPRRRYLRQRRLPTAELVRLRARPRGLIRRVKRSSTLRSAQFPPQAAAQKSRYRRLAHKLLPFPPLLPNGRAGNRLPPSAMGSMTASAPVSQESRGPQRSPAAESSAKRPVPQERKAGAQPESQKKEQTLYHRPGTAGIAPTAAGINTEAASAVQKPAAEKTVKKPFVPLTGRTPESIPSHLDLHEASQKTTKRPQESKPEVASDE